LIKIRIGSSRRKEGKRNQITEEGRSERRANQREIE